MGRLPTLRLDRRVDALDLVPENDVLVAGDVDVWEVLGREFGNQEMEYVHVCTCHMCLKLRVGRHPG